MNPTFPDPSWLVGCGNMAGAMVAGWRAAGVGMDRVTAVRPSGARVAGLKVVMNYPEGETPALVMLGIKPQKLDEVVPALAPRVGGETILVSMLAGTSAASLRERFPNARAIVRVMPNLPVAQRQGVTALYSEDDDPEARALVEALMTALGIAPWCDRAADFSAIGGVAGSGPAYVARFVDALAKGGEQLGLDPTLSALVATQTLVGTGAMVAESGEPMDALARRVASPGGTTEQGLAVLDADDGLQPLIDRMLAAAIRRGEEMAEAASRG